MGDLVDDGDFKIPSGVVGVLEVGDDGAGGLQCSGEYTATCCDVGREPLFCGVAFSHSLPVAPRASYDINYIKTVAIEACFDGVGHPCR